LKKLGIIGCQSKHAEFFGSLFNVERAFPGYQADYILGDDLPERLPYVQQTANIPVACESAVELIDKSDAVLIVHRLGQRHFEPAMGCIRKGKPVFVDKPFTASIQEARAIADASLTFRVPVLGGSTLCDDPQIIELTDLSNNQSYGTIAYRADPACPDGGYAFYGSHLTDLCAALFGIDAVSIRSSRMGDAIHTTVDYPQRSVTLYSQPNFDKPQIMFPSKGNLNITSLDDSRCYYNGMQAFIQALEEGIPNPKKLEQLVFSVQLLDAIQQSISTGEEIHI